MALRDVFHQFVSPLEGYKSAVARDDALLASKRAELEQTVAALADALAQGVIDEDLAGALRTKRRGLTADIDELGEVRAHHMAKYDAALEDERAKEFAKERAADRKIAETKSRSFAQGVGEVERAIAKLDALLPQLHEAREMALEATARLTTLAGYPVFDIDEMIRAAGPAYALGDLIYPPSYDPTTEFPRLDTAFAERAAAAKEQYDHDIGLAKPIPPSAEEIAEQESQQAEQDRIAAASEEHQRRLATDPAYVKSHFPETGVAFVAPGTEAAVSARRAAERSDGEAIRRIKSQGM